MSLTIEEYLKCKRQYQEEIAKYLAEKKTQFEAETGLDVEDIIVYTAELTEMGCEPKTIITDVSLKTKLSD